MITLTAARVFGTVLLLQGLFSAVSMASDAKTALARPSMAQYAWHEQERILFVHLSPATWEGMTHDTDGKTDLSKMNPSGFDADEICGVAKSWGARMVLLVCKHVGGFCWWPTHTTEYCTRNIPWKDGKGNLVKEVADACRRHGLMMGVYVYPDDPRYGKGKSQGGKTDDPAKQEEWNRIYRKQWEEVLTICGSNLVREVWFDGGCKIPMDDVFDRLAPKAVRFNMKHPTKQIRWVGNERGLAPDPNWNVIGGPDGKIWAPVECDVPLYDHAWFWNPKNEAKRRSLATLMNIYMQSVGHGSVMLLNATPRTDGRIPEGDKKRYHELGKAIDRNFGHPLGVVTDVHDTVAEIDLGSPTRINCADLWEDYRLGHRIRVYEVEGRVNGKWMILSRGTAVGRRKIDLFEPVMVDRVRMKITKSVGKPVIRRFLVHKVDNSLVQANLLPITQGREVKYSSELAPKHKAMFVVDGNPNLHWSAMPSDPDPWVEVDLGRPRKFAHVSMNELGNRVRKFRIEFRNSTDESWRVAYEGGHIGNDWNSNLDRVTGRFVRLHILKYIGSAPMLREFQIRDRAQAWERVGKWQSGVEIHADLSHAVIEAAEYEVRFVTEAGKSVIVDKAKLWYEGLEADKELLSGVGTDKLTIRRPHDISKGDSSAVHAVLRSPVGSVGDVQIRPKY